MSSQAYASTAFQEIQEGEDVTTRAYIEMFGVPIVLSKVSSWGLTVHEHRPDELPKLIHQLIAVPPDGYFQTAVTIDGGWKKNSVGYTFIHRLLWATTQFKGLRDYRLRYNVRTFDYGPIYLEKRLRISPTSS